MTNTVTVAQVGARWIARCSYEDRAIPKQAGFRWDPAIKQWFTTDANVAAKLADPQSALALKAEAERLAAAKQQSIELSRAATADIDLPRPEGLDYLPYQKAGIAAALDKPAVLFADEMGLGKTIQAIGLINADPTIKRVLVICPASLRLNWEREMRKWLTREMSIMLATSKMLPMSDIAIVNYDIAAKLAMQMQAVQWDLIVLDEAHYLKNPKAKRSQAILGYEEKKEIIAKPLEARRKCALTGTPIPNRPIEGFPIFHWLDPVEFKSFWGYARRYCDAQNNGFGWEMGGSSNLGELQEKLRGSIMIRRLKADVLTELPAKRRAVIELPAEGAAKGAIEAEKAAYERKEAAMLQLRAAVELAKASDDPQEYADAVADLTEASKAAFDEIAKLRHDTAVAKIPYVIEHIRNAVEAGEKVVCFAHHHDVIKALIEEFKAEAVSVFGETTMMARQVNVDRFQNDSSVKVFVGGILAAGVGLTLTASSHVVFAELDWVPGNVTQAEDRCHRIGQRDMVLVDHLVLEGSLDARMATILVEKQEVIDRALDREPEPIVPVEKSERAASQGVSREAVAAEAAKLTREQIEAIGQGLRALAGMDEDHAREVNGAGFSKIDVYIGHRLAELSESSAGLSAKGAALGLKLVNKYRRQLGADLVAAAKGTEAGLF